ncbi:MAG: DUF4153 domain-containing protein [Gammaproteobacteria bacterium]|nr:DUF4153 domain-containing protein [Gammaproteobacteria bacterium]
MRASTTLPKGAMLAIALVQGILLYLLYHAFDTDVWPSKSPVWSYPLWTLALAVPLLVLLSINRDNTLAVVKQVGAFALVLALVAVYAGWQAEPFNEFPVSSLSFAFGFSMTLACFKALMYLQQRADRVPLSYQVLFTNSWRNFLVGALSAVFVLVFWLILVLWGQLFKVIEIDFFKELFEEDWFLIPVLSVAFGLGVIIFRDLTNVIDSITKLLHWLIKVLLPLVVAVAVIFLAALPVVGLGVLWSTGRGTGLLLWLLAVMLFFTNAVYQDGREAKPYPKIIHRMIFSGLCVMPIVSALSFYGLSLRIEQYGWSVERCWAFVVWLILSLFAIGYVWGIIRRRDNWTNDLARVNTGMGLVVLAIMLLANSPLLDFRKISLHSQLGRVESGEIELGDFDFWYAKHNLARPGYLAMEKMKQDIGDSDPGLLARIESPAYPARNISIEMAEQMWTNMLYRPEPFEIPVALKPMLETSIGMIENATPVIIRSDLDDDGQDEYLLLTVHEYGIGYSQFYYLTNDGWRAGNVVYTSWQRNAGAQKKTLEEGEIELVEPRFKHIKIGEITLKPTSND